MAENLISAQSQPTISETPIYRLDHRQRYSLPNKTYVYKQRRSTSPPPQPPSTPVGRWTPSFGMLDEDESFTKSIHLQSSTDKFPGTPCSQSLSSFEDVELSTDEMSDCQPDTLMSKLQTPTASPARRRCNHATSYSCDHEKFCRISNNDRPKSKVYRTSLTRRHAVVRRERTCSDALAPPLSPSAKPIFSESASPQGSNSPVSSTAWSSISQDDDDYYNWGEVSYFEDWDDDTTKKSRLRSFSLTSSFLKANGRNSMGGKQPGREKSRRSLSGLFKDLSCAR